MLFSVLLVGLAWQYRSQRIEQVEANPAERPIFRYGELALEYSTVDQSGHPVKIEKGSDRLTLLVFFKPIGIHETLTYLNAVNARYKGKGLRIIGVSGGSVEQTESFVSQSALEYPIVSDFNGEMHQAFKFHSDHDHGGTLLLNEDLKVEFASTVSHKFVSTGQAASNSNCWGETASGLPV
jgi:peroxiredoxin